MGVPPTNDGEDAPAANAWRISGGVFNGVSMGLRPSDDDEKKKGGHSGLLGALLGRPVRQACPLFFAAHRRAFFRVRQRYSNLQLSTRRLQ